MTLAKSAIDIPLGTSLDESAAKELLDPMASPSVANNVVVLKRGAYTKRRGSVRYPKAKYGGNTVAAGLGIYEYEQSYPLMCDGDTLYEYDTKTSTWVSKDRVPNVVVTRAASVQPPPQARSYAFDSVVCNGYRVTAYSAARGTNGGFTNDGNNTNYCDLFVQVTSVDSGTVVYGPVLLAQVFGAGAPSNFSIAATATRVVITTTEAIRNVSNVVTKIGNYAWTLDLSGAVIPAPTRVMWDEDPTGVGTGYGLTQLAVSKTPVATNSLAYIYYSPGTANWRCLTFNAAAGTFSSSTCPRQDIAVGSATRMMELVYDAASTTYWFLWRDNAGSYQYRVAVFSAAFALLANVAISLSEVTFIDRTKASSCCAGLGPLVGAFERDLWIAISTSIEGGSAEAYTYCIQARRSAAAVIDLTNYRPPNVNGYARFGVYAYSVPFMESGRWYQWFQTSPRKALTQDYLAPIPSTRTIVLCEVRADLAALRPVANIAPGIVGSIFSARYPHHVQALGSRAFETSVFVQRNASTYTLETARTDFASQDRMVGAAFGDVLAFSGGTPSYYDGVQMAEVGFVQEPSILATPSTTGGTMAAGTYSCFAVWRFTDAKGNLHVSNISNIETFVTTGATSSVSVDWNPLVMTARDFGDRGARMSSIRIALYATRVNEGTFYLVGENVASLIDIRANVTQSPYQPFVMTGQDQNKLFYTQPGVLNAALFRYSPPPLRSMIQHNGALVGVAEDGRTIWFSGQRLAGEGAWFNPAFVATVDDSAPVSALASMDGRLYVFTQAGIWGIDGDGFADNGDGGYAAPVRIAADAGCTNARSVVVTPIGILFQGELGIALFSRSGEVNWFGRVVEDTLRANGNVTSATLVRTLGECRFTFASGVTLVWNYRDNVWTTSTYASGAGDLVSACMVQRGADAVWHRVHADGTVLYESSTAATDELVAGFSYTATKVQTAWIKVAGVQGFQRVWRVLAMFQRLGNAGLRMSLSYDYLEAAVEVRTWTAAEVAALPKGEVEIHCARQKCTAIRITLECVSPGGTLGAGESHTYTGLRLILGVKGKTPRGAKAR